MAPILEEPINLKADMIEASTVIESPRLASAVLHGITIIDLQARSLEAQCRALAAKDARIADQDGLIVRMQEELRKQRETSAMTEPKPSSKNVIPAGTTLTITTGAYSDYRDYGPFLVIKEIDKATVANEFTGQWKLIHDGDRPDGLDFIAWLSQYGYIEDVAGSQTWHAGDYDFEPEFEL
jgi:hypothetical protein